MHTPSLHYPDSIKLFLGHQKIFLFSVLTIGDSFISAAPWPSSAQFFAQDSGVQSTSSPPPPPIPVYTMTLDFIYASRIFPCTLVQCTYTVRGGGHKVREKNWWSAALYILDAVTPVHRLKPWEKIKYVCGIVPAHAAFTFDLPPGGGEACSEVRECVGWYCCTHHTLHQGFKSNLTKLDLLSYLKCGISWGGHH